MKKTVIKIITARLKEAMESKNINQAQLAELSGIPRTSINQLVTGRNMKTKKERIEKIAKVLNVSTYWLQGEINFKRRIITSDDVMLHSQYIMNNDEIFKMNQEQDRIDIIQLLKEESIYTDLSCLLKHFEELKTINERDYKLLAMYNQLSEIGKDRCDQYIGDLLKIKEYHETY